MSAGTESGADDESGPTVHADNEDAQFLGAVERDGVVVVTLVDDDASRSAIRRAQEACRLEIEEERR